MKVHTGAQHWALVILVTLATTSVLCRAISSSSSTSVPDKQLRKISDESHLNARQDDVPKQNQTTTATASERSLQNSTESSNAFKASPPEPIATVQPVATTEKNISLAQLKPGESGEDLLEFLASPNMSKLAPAASNGVGQPASDGLLSPALDDELNANLAHDSMGQAQDSPYKPACSAGTGPQPLAASSNVLPARPVVAASSAPAYKVVAKVDHWIITLERFTLTREWSSLLKIFQGVESILDLFVNSTAASNSKQSQVKKLPLVLTNNASAVPSESTITNVTVRVTIQSRTTDNKSSNNATSVNKHFNVTSVYKHFNVPSSVIKHSNNVTSSTSRQSNVTEAASNLQQSKVVQPNIENTTLLLESFKTALPGQVLTITDSLNNLFPWHVWPWNNLDLYTTIDTFLNHGIFAFSKTTLGPNRRIDLLPNMLKTLFNSLKYDTFPKKCNDWSKIICNSDSFHDRLVVPPTSPTDTTEVSNSNSSKAREEKVKELSAISKNQLTQELTCIMFSSLSMQQFGGGKDVENSDLQNTAKSADMHDSSSSSSRLSWDRQVHKAIKLYALSREALTDEQWLSLYNLIRNLWSQQKISDRVIMVGRVIQLLTSCHMPKEMLESALWKDIYKYKNALNQLVDIVIEELNRSSENGKLTIDQITLGSKHLHEILKRFIKLTPQLVRSLSQTVVDQLPELVNRFFNEKVAFFKVPCKGYSFSDIIPSLEKHRKEILEIEELVCEQLKIKPNITMMQINNLTNEFLAMAFNFSNFGTGLTLPKLLTNLETSPQSNVEPGRQNSAKKRSSSYLSDNQETLSAIRENATSIVDEMAANPRLSQIVAILQSSPLDPPEVHAELPELDWVEAGTSVALLYESIQKLISYEEPFIIFPEIENFQEEMGKHVDKSQQMFKKFSKRDPIRLVAYGLDVSMPIALRTYKPADSFHAECLSSFRDIFSEEVEGKPTRQWQCLVSSMNFASWATNNFMRTFNGMFRNILEQMNEEVLGRNGRIATTSVQQANSTNNTCIFLDGSVSMMLDNLPQFIDLALETVLMASTTSDQQLTLYDIMCSSNYMLDPFNERSIELKARMKDKMCHLFHKNSLANCAKVLRFDQWASTMRDLNSTWFESNAISITPSFRDITQNVHEFLELFGQFKPSTMQDSLIARVLNVNSFWVNLLNRTMTIIDKYQEKRFEYALQTLTPIIYDNLPRLEKNSSSVVIEEEVDLKEVRETLITTILGAKAILNYLDKQSNNNNASLTTNKNITSSRFETQIQSLFHWADQYSMVAAETLLKTIANNITKLENIFKLTDTISNSSSQVKFSLEDIWARFCSAPVETYLDLKRPANFSESSNSTSQNSDYSLMSEGKEIICKFDWPSFYNQLAADSNKILEEYPERQLTRIALTKWGQVLDVMLIESKSIKQLPKFFYMDYWQLFREKLPQISPQKDQPSSLVWIWKGFERLANAMDAGSNQTSQSLLKILDQLNCGLDAVKGGLSWENIGNIYQDKQDILAAHSTINNGFALASIGVNTFFAHKKFQKFLDVFVKPRVGLNAFCEMRDRSHLESVFSIPEGQDYVEALESFQELICDTNFETLAQNINPISICYQTNMVATTVGTNKTITPVATITSAHPLADIMDRFFKLASLAVLDAKLVVASDAKPPILDKKQWSTFWEWWSDRADPQVKNSVALAVVRAFQTMDSVNSNHVVWKALFRSIHEISEIAAYLLRAVEKKHHEKDMIGAASRLSLVKEAATQIDSAIRNNGIGGGNTLKQVQQQQQLASTLSNIMFPEVNNFISFRTFKQLRYIKSISDYFSTTKDAQESVCRNVSISAAVFDKSDIGRRQSRIELIGYKINSNEKLFALLCHYHSSQWLSALNIVISTRTSSIPKKISYMTKYLSIFTRNYRETESLENFIHEQQIENIENVANTTVSYLLSASHSLKSLSFSKISNVSWHSLPNLLDSIDRHLCASKYEPGTFRIPVYEPKRPELEIVICKLPQWNITQVYNYFSENFDLQNMISLITHQNNSFSSPPTPPTGSFSSPELISTNGKTKQSEPSATNQTRTCVTPFKFASRWLKMGQETVDEMMSKTSRDKLRKCLSSYKKSQSFYSQSLRYVKFVNSLLSTINDLTANDSWHIIKKTWTSISYLIINHQIY